MVSQSTREELINLSQEIHSDTTNLMRSYTEGRDKLKFALEEQRKRQQETAAIEAANVLNGLPNKVLWIYISACIDLKCL